MCKSIESAILGFANCIFNLIIILKFTDKNINKYYIPFILNLAMVQFGNIILWMQYDGKTNLKKNKTNKITTKFILSVLMLQSFTISYMFSKDYDSNSGINNLILILTFLIGISKSYDYIKSKDIFTTLKDGKVLEWTRPSKNGKYLFYLFDIIPFILAYLYSNNKKFTIELGSIFTLIYLLVLKYGKVWGSEWCAYGTGVVGYITLFVLGKKNLII
tara:strand:- start:303 stop:953 length:651 start_codon:yes stop_codon:yes gene_type:complete